MHGLLRQWLRTLSAKRQKRRLEKQPLQKSEGWSNPDWSRDQFDTPTAHFERVPCGYVPKEGETLYECFVGRYSSGVWRATRKVEEKRENASEN